MSYELSIALKVGSIEVEFDNLDELEAKLERLDIGRIERAVLAALRRRGPAKEASPAKRGKTSAAKKRTGKKTTAKKTARRSTGA